MCCVSEIMQKLIKASLKCTLFLVFSVSVIPLFTYVYFDNKKIMEFVIGIGIFEAELLTLNGV